MCETGDLRVCVYLTPAVRGEEQSRPAPGLRVERHVYMEPSAICIDHIPGVPVAGHIQAWDTRPVAEVLERIGKGGAFPFYNRPVLIENIRHGCAGFAVKGHSVT